MSEILLRTVSVAFPENSTRYSYFVPVGDTPTKGDLVVTSINYDMGNANILGSAPGVNEAQFHNTRRAVRAMVNTGIITEVDSVASAKATKFYLALLPVALLKEKQEANYKFFERARERAAAKEKLDIMLREHTATELYRSLAATNPEAARLLALLES